MLAWFSAANGPRLAVEAITEPFHGDFDCDVASEARVVRSIDFPHPAGTQRRDDLAPSEFVIRGEGHRI